MAIQVRPGAKGVFSATLVDLETYTPLPGREVELQMYDGAIGDYRTINRGTTGPDGMVMWEVEMPTALGTYRFRTRWAGDPEYRADTSPPLRIEVIAA